MEMKAYHLDFNYVSRSPEMVARLLDQAAALGYDSILWELEDQVAWKSCPQIAHKGSWSRETFSALLEHSRRLGLEPVPLLQTIGHAEYMLRHFPGLREQPQFTDCYCTSNPNVKEFLLRLIEEYLEVFGKVRLFHLGCDEAYRFGSCPDCSGKDKEQLFAEHLASLSAPLASAGIHPCIWSDMLVDNPGILKRLPENVVIWNWDYACTPEAPFPNARQLASQGHQTVACASIRSWLDNMFVPNAGMHVQNILAMAAFSPESFCVTSWSIRLNPIALSEPVLELPMCMAQSGADKLEDVLRRLSLKHFNLEDGFEGMALIGSPAPELDSFSGTQWTRLKDSSRPPKGYLLSLMDTRQKREQLTAKAEETLRAIERGAAILKRSRTRLADLWLAGARMRSDFTRLVLACLDETCLASDVAAFTDRSINYFALEETSASARKNATLVMAPFADFLNMPEQ